MKIKKNVFFLFFDKRYYNPPSKRKWSKQNDKYKTRRPLAEKFNIHKINIKGEYWKQKHVNKQFVVENDNIDMINEKTSLNFFGYPNISLHNKLGGSLYIEQMDEITLCVIMNKCIKENIYDSFIWKNLLNRCTRIMNKMNGNILSYIFKYSSQSHYYNHYFFITMIGNISSNLYSFNLKNCSNVLFAMNNNSDFYNEEIYKKIIEHSSLLILNRNDIDVNDILSIINSFYIFKNRNTNEINNLDSYNIYKNVNYAYLLFDSISKTFKRYDLDLCEIDYVCSSLLSLCLLDRINLFFQERNRNVINKLINYLNNNMEKLNIKHISVLCFASCVFKNSENLKWKNIFRKIEKECYLLDDNYISILAYSLKGKILENKNIYNIIYNKIFDTLNSASLENLSLITYSFLKYNNINNIYVNNEETKIEGNNIENDEKIKEEKKKRNYLFKKGDKEGNFNYSFNLFNDFLYGKIKYNANNFSIFQIFLIFKGLSETKLQNNKIEDLKVILLDHICKNIYTIPIYLLSYFSKIITNSSIKDKELINSIKNISLIYLNIYKYLYIEDSDYVINANFSLIEEYYSTVNNENKIKSDITFLYNEKKKEITYLSEKYLINHELFKRRFKYLNENFNISKEQIEKIFQFSKNYFFNYYLKEKHLANFFYFCTLMDKENANIYFNEIKTIIYDKIINKHLKFCSSSILYIFKTLDQMNMIQKQNKFFNILLKQLCDEIFSINISIFFQLLIIFYKNKISHYYFLKKAKYIINMNKYELSENTLINMNNMIFELNKLLY
ncbi:conserved Plasmodium protein, unknown function [Plasmodium gallinaceum]|uniref:Uncharacterized protein n=1 Tax=Plasmodium gallinaceum TaxID=5849 RepID=A0A1J1GX69_PLAGA|nr:conserved Plasmodium protein, unknown function [Plasmodium gallinaceum]CRG95616.1 conserved Plasmodium protein, unknown function [Plasmodium gallinaceum]